MGSGAVDRDDEAGGRLRVRGPVALRGRLRMPGDKSVSHRALLLSALADGTSLVRGLSDGSDVAATGRAIEALGASVEVLDGGVVRVGGRAGTLAEPDGVIDVGNSGTAIRLLAGVAASQPHLTILVGDASVHRRPMGRVAVPLRLMGASVDGREGGRFAPLVVRGGSLHGIDYDQPVASAQVKSAVLLAGLGASGETVVREPARSRAHTEEMLAQAGADIEVDAELCVVRLRPSTLEPQEWVVPGDPSQAAFWLAAAAALPGSDVTVEGLYLGPSRAGFLDVLRRMGAELDVDEAAGRVTVVGGALRGTDVAAAEIPGLVDEVPALAVAAALAEGVTRFLGAAELRVKESDRLATIASELGRLGASVEASDDELVVRGGGPGSLRGATVGSHGDHRIAMAAAVAGLAATGDTIVEGTEAIATSYPSFAADLAALAGDRPLTADPGVGVGAGADAGTVSEVLVVALDGPAGTGKSTVARAVAARLGVDYLDTGAMYRAVTWAALRDGLVGGRTETPTPEGELGRLARQVDLALDAGTGRVSVDGTDVTTAIRGPEVTAAVSAVSAVPEVRAVLRLRQRAWAEAAGGGVVEGRDVGTVVFPDATLKVYLTARPEVRAARRAAQAGGDVDAIAADMARRDHADSSRADSPLSQAADAVLVDTSDLTLEQVVDLVASEARPAGAGMPGCGP